MDKRKIVKAILEYDRKIQKEAKSPSVNFAGEKFVEDIKANEFLLKHPNAFLFGVIFDQGILAEKAWSAPYILKQRLGHFDLKKMVLASSKKIREKVTQKPALHRYHYLGDWIYEAAKKILEEYKGNASNIWEGNLSAKEVRRRFLEFKGIGPKKANMAVRILKKTFKVKFGGMCTIDVPYDIHVRRVFLRTGFVERDSIKTITEAARRLYPKEPSRLDAVWHIGKNFCHPRNPECRKCSLDKVCPKIGVN